MLLATKIANSMILNRTAKFFDPEATWQSLEALPTDASAGLLLEQHMKRFSEADLYLGLVAATGERALWLKFPGRLHERPMAPYSDSLWVKTIEYSNHSVLTVVLTESAAAFTEFACDLLEAIRDSSVSSLTKHLFALLQRWQPYYSEPIRHAA